MASKVLFTKEKTPEAVLRLYRELGFGSREYELIEL